jgi:uncharacterized protein YegP (UPF0339 family)
MAPHFEIYKERDADGFKSSGLWRWRFIAGNGENTANGSEGYAGEGNVRRAVRQHCEQIVAIVGSGVSNAIKVVDK